MEVSSAIPAFTCKGFVSINFVSFLFVAVPRRVFLFASVTHESAFGREVIVEHIVGSGSIRDALVKRIYCIAIKACKLFVAHLLLGFFQHSVKFVFGN